ncbi:MAG: polyphenol oxidase family protein [Planctomycetes bacterium]|nr:polyphenol oxidase family protein [Planctomycetota bacterium]
MKRAMPANNHFYLAEQENTWITGHFRALDALNVRHLVSTRQGLDVEFVRRRIDQAIQQVARTLDATHGAWLHQVHGATALRSDKPGLVGEADALYTDQPGLLLVGQSADCPLILIAEKQGLAVGFAHASWRSTVAGVTSNLIKGMTHDLHCHARDLVACICPSAGPECYEVGAEVRDQAISQLGPRAETFFVAQNDRFLFDLWQANTHALEQSGLLPDHIHIAGMCTLCHNDLFPSYRKEGNQAGRFVGAIVL